MLHFDAFADKLPSTVRRKYFRAYVHIDVVVKLTGQSSMHADDKFNLISLFGVTAQKLRMRMIYIKPL
jgi:hypothetical protein